MKKIERPAKAGEKIYVLSDNERAAIREGLEQAQRGEFVPEKEMAAFWRRVGEKK